MNSSRRQGRDGRNYLFIMLIKKGDLKPMKTKLIKAYHLSPWSCEAQNPHIVHKPRIFTGDCTQLFFFSCGKFGFWFLPMTLEHIKCIWEMEIQEDGAH